MRRRRSSSLHLHTPTLWLKNTQRPTVAVCDWSRSPGARVEGGGGRGAGTGTSKHRTRETSSGRFMLLQLDPVAPRFFFIFSSKDEDEYDNGNTGS